MGLFFFWLPGLVAFLKIRYKFSYAVPEECRKGMWLYQSLFFASFCPVCGCEKENVAYISFNMLCEF